MQKIKPRVEQVCQELGLQYATEENTGRIYVNLTGGEAVMPPHSGHQYSSQPQQSYPGQQQHYSGGQQQQQQQPQQQDEIEQVVNALLPKVMRKLEKACCVVM